MSSKSSSTSGLIFALIYRQPCAQTDITSGAFQVKDADVFGTVNFFDPFVVL